LGLFVLFELLTDGGLATRTAMNLVSPLEIPSRKHVDISDRAMTALNLSAASLQHRS
jgi:hypothetical protein